MEDNRQRSTEFSNWEASPNRRSNRLIKLPWNVFLCIFPHLLSLFLITDFVWFFLLILFVGFLFKGEIKCEMLEWDYFLAPCRLFSSPTFCRTRLISFYRLFKVYSVRWDCCHQCQLPFKCSKGFWHKLKTFKLVYCLCISLVKRRSLLKSFFSCDHGCPIGTLSQLFISWSLNIKVLLFCDTSFCFCFVARSFFGFVWEVFPVFYSLCLFFRRYFYQNTLLLSQRSTMIIDKVWFTLDKQNHAHIAFARKSRKCC